MAANAIVQLRVLRPLGASFLFHSSSAAQSVAVGDTIHTFDANVPIAAGDRIGVDRVSGGLLPFTNPASGSVVESWHPALPNGATAAPSFDDFDRELLLNADIEPTSAFVVKKRRPKKKGKLRVTASLPNPGTFEAGDRLDTGIGVVAAAKKKRKPKRLLKSAATPVGAPGQVNLLLKPTKAAIKQLKRKAKRKGKKNVRIKAKIRVAFTPTFGSPSVQVVKVSLKR